MNRILVLLVATSLVCLPLFAETVGQLGGMDSDGNYYWTIDDDGTLIGGTGAEISLGGTATVGDVLTLSAELLLSNETVTCSSGDPQGTGVADPDKVITFVVTDDAGASADLVTLANGTTAGEIKIIILKTDTETTGLIVRPATYGGGTEVLFEDAGDGCTLVWDGTSWNMVSNNGGTES